MRLVNRAVGRYMELVEELPLKPLRNDKDLTRATTMLNRLLDSEELDRDEQDYLQVLGGLIKEYEDKHHPMESVSPSQLLAHLIESKGVSHRAVAQATHINETAISNLLAGRRAFNRNHIDRLAKYFKISPAAFFPK